MKIQINKKHTINLKNNSDGDWYGVINLNSTDFEFTIYNEQSIDWGNIKSRIDYFINHHLEIIEIAEKGVIEHQKFLGWNLNYDFDLDCIELPVGVKCKDDFIIPYRYDDETGFDYVMWTIHIFDENGPKLREVKREWFLAFDTYYFENKTKTVCISFSDWENEDNFKINTEIIDSIEEYISGEFYKRELPCILSLISKIGLD